MESSGIVRNQLNMRRHIKYIFHFLWHCDVKYALPKMFGALMGPPSILATKGLARFTVFNLAIGAVSRITP